MKEGVGSVTMMGSSLYATCKLWVSSLVRRCAPPQRSRTRLDRRELTYAHNVGAGAESLQLVAVAGRARFAGVCGEGAVNAALACCCCGDCESGCE